MRPLAAAVVVLALFPALGRAQGLGLDLSDDAKKEKPAEQPPPPPPPTDEGTTGPKVTDDRPVKKEETQLTEKDITQQDRVKAIQKKLYLKTHRMELAVAAGATFNDPFYTKTGEFLKVSYFFADSLGIGIRGMAMQVNASADVHLASSLFQSVIHLSQPDFGATGELEWSPLYGKAAIFNSIVHFDGYLIGGIGAVHTAASKARGFSPAGDVGVGLRFILKDWLAVNASYFNLSFLDVPVGGTQSQVQNLQYLTVGLSLFLPLKSTGRESE